MRPLLALAALAALAAPALAQPASSADEARVRALEDQVRIALLHGDARTLAALWAEDVALDLPGHPLVRGRDAAVALVARGGLGYRQLTWRVDRVDARGDVALVSGEETRYPAGVEASAPPAPERFVHRWVREGGRWALAAVYVAGPAARGPTPPGD